MYYTIETLPKENKLHGTVLVEVDFMLNDVVTESERKWFTNFQIRTNEKEIANSIPDRRDEFLNDLNDLRNFGSWLKRRNKPLSGFKPDKRMYQKHLPELIKIMNIICEKYNLYYAVD